MAEDAPGGQQTRGQVSDDRDRHGVESQVLRQPRGYRRPGNTYTVDTLRDLRAERGDDVDLFFITGADAVRQILTWHGAERLFDLAHFVGVTGRGCR